MHIIDICKQKLHQFRFQGDHDYYYSSPTQALEIVWEVNRRRGVLRRPSVAVWVLRQPDATHRARQRAAPVLPARRRGGAPVHESRRRVRGRRRERGAGALGPRRVVT